MSTDPFAAVDADEATVASEVTQLQSDTAAAEASVPSSGPTAAQIAQVLSDAQAIASAAADIAAQLSTEAVPTTAEPATAVAEAAPAPVAEAETETVASEAATAAATQATVLTNPPMTTEVAADEPVAVAGSSLAVPAEGNEVQESDPAPVTPLPGEAGYVPPTQ